MILEKGSKSPGERVLVTVLFVEIMGFSTLADLLKPEQVSLETKALWEEFNQIIKEHGGLIINQLGDSLMVVWGAPESQEDDTEKAVFACLALLNGLTRFKESASHPAVKGLRLRMGIHTGLALAGYVGARGEYTVLGDTVNIAKRMEESGQPGDVIVSVSFFRIISFTNDAFVLLFSNSFSDDVFISGVGTENGKLIPYCDSIVKFEVSFTSKVNKS